MHRGEGIGAAAGALLCAGGGGRGEGGVDPFVALPLSHPALTALFTSV